MVGDDGFWLKHRHIICRDVNAFVPHSDGRRRNLSQLDLA